jgi:hypothetical protein
MSKIEVASTGRATCRGCRKAIAKGELRFGEEHGAFGFDGNMTLWYHLACAALKRPEQLRPVLAKYKKPIPDRESIEASFAGAVTANRTSKLLSVDRAPTGRAKCQHCKRVIEKATLRAALLLDADPTMPGTGFLHLACAPTFADADVTAHLKAKSKKLAKADQKALVAVLGAVTLLDTNARGKTLEADAAKVLRAKKPPVDPPEVSVLADWLEEQGSAIAKDELLQVLKARA